jgi:hypothetical protein
MPKEIEAMLRTLTDVIRQSLADGRTLDEAVRLGELAVRREYAGERVYIARLPKAQHRHDLQALGTGEISPILAAHAIGVSRRTIFRLRKGQ